MTYKVLSSTGRNEGVSLCFSSLSVPSNTALAVEINIYPPVSDET